MASILRTGGSVRNSQLNILGTVVPGIRGVMKGGISIRKHLPDWGGEVLDLGLFQTPIEKLMKTDQGKARIKTVIKMIRDGKLSYVGLMGAVYKLNDGAKFVNVAADERVKAIMQFATIVPLFEIAKPTAELGVQLGAISPIDNYQANQRLGAAADQLLNVTGLGKVISEALND